MPLNSISYPHPVLGNGDDIAGGVMEPVIEYSITDEAIRLHVNNLSTGHSSVDMLIDSEHAQWQIRVKCARTYMRENFVVSGPEWTKTLSGTDYEGIVKIETQVLAVNDIEDYSPTGAHADYGDEVFQIKTGELLAIGPIFSFHIDKVFDPLKAPVASLLKVKEGEHDTGPFQLDLDDDMIFVKLSKADWQEYAGIRDRVPALLHSAIVMPVLATAITELNKYEGTLWAGRLRDLIERKEIDISHPLTAAQELLGSPLKRTFDEVNTKLDKGVF